MILNKVFKKTYSAKNLSKIIFNSSENFSNNSNIEMHNKTENTKKIVNP